jgi:protein phosphatase
VFQYDHFEHAAVTDVGIRRSHNQDSYTVVLAPDPKRWRAIGHVFHVADGMGAHAVGELASEIATRTIAHTYGKYAQDGIVPALRKAFTEANAAIHERGQKNPEFGGMGTTSTCLVLRADGAWVGHVGDSRAYRIRNGTVQQLSFDHSLLWEKAKRKHVRPEDMVGVPHNVIVRSLGPEAEVEADIQGPHPIEEGDIFLLCSDGLSGPLTDRELGAVSSVLPPKEACEFLIDLANLRGGPDNITVIIVRIGEPTNPKKKKPRAVDDDDDDRVRWYQRVPWPLWVLLIGVLLAGAAAGLVVNKLLGPVGPMLFLLAVLTILAGLGCLFFYHKKEKERQEREPEYRPRVKIYRESECTIDESLVNKLTRAEEVLVNRARDQKWDGVDWKAQQKHHQAAQELVANGDFPGAFRETCRAMQPLTRALRTIRHKEEAFNPHWEKTED